MNIKNYIELNKKSWNEKTEIHYHSDFYNTPAFINGKNSLNEIELNLLGDIQGKKILHLQCHFGQDTLSLQRLGASVTGVDFSEAAIEKAKALNEQLGLSANFICCDLYSLPQHLHNEQFDIVFTSYGTIGWLPDLDKWAAIINQYLKPDGQFVFVEFHPLIWMYDNDFTKITYSYFQQEAIVETESGSYASRESGEPFTTITWNHSIGEVVTAMTKQGFFISDLQEYDFSPYNCLSYLTEVETGKYRINDLQNFVPMVYSLVAKR
ncbi:MAG: class I SAM-dependent methyltransferase [Bacteroidota bacterium]